MVTIILKEYADVFKMPGMPHTYDINHNIGFVDINIPPPKLH